MSIKKLQRYDIDEDGDLVSDSAYGYYCLTKDVTELEATNAELVRLLDLAWGAIQEAGYEDHSFDLRDKIEKYIDQGVIYEQ